MQQAYLLLAILYGLTLILTLLPCLFLYFCRDRHFKLPIRVPPPPLKTRKTFKMENRFKEDKSPLPQIELSQIQESVEHVSTPSKYVIRTPMEDDDKPGVNANNPEMSEQRMAPDVKHIDDFPQMVFDDKPKVTDSNIKPMPRFGDFQDVPQIEVSTFHPQHKSSSKSKVRDSIAIIKHNPKTEEEVDWKIFYCLESYVLQMAKYYIHLRYTFRAIKRKNSLGCCTYFGISLLYLTPILSLFTKFEGGWNRALRGYVFSIRLHSIAALLCLIRVSYYNSSFVILFGLIFSLLMVPLSLWKVLFIPKLGNQKAARRISLGLLRMLPVLEKSHSFRYSNPQSDLIQVILSIVYLGASTCIIILSNHEGTSQEITDAMLAFFVAVGVGVVVIGPITAIINAIILSCCRRRSCCSNCLRSVVLSEHMTEVENDIDLLRNLWLAEETTSQEYHTVWKKGVLATVITY